MQFVLFFLADRAFHWVLALGYIIVYIIVMTIAVRLDQRRHLRWLIPYLVGAIIDLLSMSVYNVHIVLGIRWSPQEFMIADLVTDATTVISAYGTLVLYSILVEWFRESQESVPQAGTVGGKLNDRTDPGDYSS